MDVLIVLDCEGRPFALSVYCGVSGAVLAGTSAQKPPKGCRPIPMRMKAATSAFESQAAATRYCRQGVIGGLPPVTPPPMFRDRQVPRLG